MAAAAAIAAAAVKQPTVATLHAAAAKLAVAKYAAAEQSEAMARLEAAAQSAAARRSAPAQQFTQAEHVPARDMPQRRTRVHRVQPHLMQQPLTPASRMRQLRAAVVVVAVDVRVARTIRNNLRDCKTAVLELNRSYRVPLKLVKGRRLLAVASTSARRIQEPSTPGLL